MALQKTKELATGATGNYWKIIETNINYLAETSHVTMALFKDKAARDAGKDPMSSESFDWSGEDFLFTVAALEDSNPIALAYAKIKESNLNEDGEETNFFASATNV